MNRRVLVISYYFPPSGGVGYERTLKYVTYLPESGWDATVLTTSDAGYGLRDMGSIGRIPAGMPVIRAASVEPAKVRKLIGKAVRSVRALVSRPTGSKSAAGDGSASASSPSAPTSTRPNRPAYPMFLADLWRTAIGFLFFPDEQIGWVPFAIRRGTELVSSEPFDAIYSSSGPISCHLVASMVARRSGLPWVADFRDPWIGNAFAPALPAWQRAMQRRMERAIVRRADAVVLVTDGMLREYRARYPWAADKFVVIPNGYDRNDFGPKVLARIAERSAERRRHADGERFKLVYAGSVYGDRELGIFLDGLELLLARRPELRDRIAVEYIGRLNVHNQAVAAEYDTPDRLAGIVTYSPFVPHAVALERMVEADALFHVIADEPGKGLFLSGKLPEYVGLDRQVLAFVPEGSARSFLRELDWGIVDDPTPEGVARGVERAVEAAPPDRPADPERRYDRATLARRLAAVLDDVTGN